MPFSKVETLPLSIPLEVGKQDEQVMKDLLHYAKLDTEDRQFTGDLFLSVPTGELIIMNVSRRGIVLGDMCKISLSHYALAGFNRLVEEIKKRDL